MITGCQRGEQRKIGMRDEGNKWVQLSFIPDPWPLIPHPSRLRGIGYNLQTQGLLA